MLIKLAEQQSKINLPNKVHRVNFLKNQVTFYADKLEIIPQKLGHFMHPAIRREQKNHLPFQMFFIFDANII